jgi:hypothetical protein
MVTPRRNEIPKDSQQFGKLTDNSEPMAIFARLRFAANPRGQTSVKSNYPPGLQ